MAIFDALGQYASNRFTSAIDNMNNRMTSAGQYLTDPRAALEQRMRDEEEERKRREREQQMMAEMEQRQRDMEAANTAVKQTIVTNPDGSQEMTIKGTPQALSGMNPNTPTVTGPAIPNVMGQQQDQQQQQQAAAIEEERRRREQQAAEQQQRVMQERMLQQQAGVAPAPGAASAAEPVAGPVPPSGPSQDEIMREQEQRRQYEQMMARPAPAPATPVSPAAMASGQGPQPVVQFGQPIPVPPREETAPPVEVAQAPAATATDVTAGTTGAANIALAPGAVDYSKRFQTILTNRDELARVLGTSTDPVEKKIAADLLRVNLQGQQDEQRAAETVTRALQGDRDAQTQMQRDLKRGEGSYIKAYLFARLGLNQLAAEEQAKLGTGGRTVESMTLNGKSYTVQRDRNGQILAAYDEAGDRVTNRTIANLQAAGVRGTADTSVGADVYSDPTGKTVKGNFVLERRAGNSVFREIGTNRIATAEESQALRKLGVQGTLSDAAQRQIQTANINLQEEWAKLKQKVAAAGPEAGNKFLGEFTAKFGVPVTMAQLSGDAPQIDMQTGQILPPVMRQVTGGTAQAAPPAAAPATSPGAPAAPPAGGAAPGGRVGAAQGGTPAQVMANQAVAQAGAEAEAQARGTAVGKETGLTAAQVEKNQRMVDSTISVIRPINEALKDATGSYLGAGVDEVARLFGISTKGSQATARLNILSEKILRGVPRFEGPQSDRDVAMYQQAAGRLNDRTLPIKDRLAALQTITEILKEYDKAGKHDWTQFGGGQSATSGTTSTGVRWKESR